MSSQSQRGAAFPAAMAILAALAGCDGRSGTAPEVTPPHRDVVESPATAEEEEPSPTSPEGATLQNTVCPKDTPPGPYDDRAAQCVEIFGTTTIDPSETQTLSCRGWGEHPGLPEFRDMYEVGLDHPRTWQSSDEQIFRVSKLNSYQASITGVAPGTAEVHCKIDQAPWGFATVSVSGTRTLVSMFILPNPVTLFPGQSRDVATHFVDNYGQTDRIHPSVDEWASDNTNVATVGEPFQFGGQVARVTAIASAGPDTDGTAHVTARVGSIVSSPSTITVRPAPRVETVSVTPTGSTVQVGQTVTLTATPRDQYGNVMTGKTATWSTSDAAVATVSSSGVVTGVGGGQASIFATIDGVTGHATVTVLAVTTVSVSPATDSVFIGGTVTLTATARDQFGNVMSGQTATWTTSNANIATVTSTGDLTASVQGVAEGQVTITATIRGKAGTSTVTVQKPPLSVHIYGPHLGYTVSEQCTWYAYVSGGVAPYQYQWVRNGMTVSTTYSYSGNIWESFTLTLTVTDFEGAEKTDQAYVQHDYSWSGCQMVY